MIKYDYSEDKVKFLKNNIKGHTLKELTILFNNQFNTELNHHNIREMTRTLKISTGNDGRFKKGHKSWNKGKKMSKETYEKCKGTMFKCGHENYNSKPLGSERVKGNGYIYTKVANPNIWKPKHRVIWENNFGPIPEGHFIIFADSNKRNFNLDNLILVSKKELLILNKEHLIKSDTELTKIGVTIAKVINKINE